MMPKKERRAALFSSLTVRAKEGQVFALEGFAEKTPKTKALSTLLGKLPVGKKYLFVLPEKNDVLQKSAANLPMVKTLLASYLNPSDVLQADQVCLVGKTPEVLEKTFLSSK
jgi:large subunit ribosomal protein L4